MMNLEEPILGYQEYNLIDGIKKSIFGLYWSLFCVQPLLADTPMMCEEH